MTAIIILAFLAIPLITYSRGYSAESPKLIVFYSHTCRSCIEINHKVMPQIERKFKDRISVEYRDITEIQNYKLLLSLEQKYGAKIKNVLPVFYLEGHFISGKGQNINEIERFITYSLETPFTGTSELTVVDLIARFRNFGLFTIISAGLIDGINPCAFTVIVFFISFLALQGYRKRELIVIGLSFMLAVFLTYILIGVGLFGFLYRIKGFWLISKILNITIGILCFVLGIFALYDFVKFIRTKSTEELTLQLSPALKNRIHSIIGGHYRKTPDKEAEMRRRGIWGLLISALATGFLVSIIEAVCTGQVYLPTIIFVLKATSLKLQALAYILIYNIMFILPLFVIFLFALLGVTSEQFSVFLKRHLAAVKIVMAMLFFALGIVLVYSQTPQDLSGANLSEVTSTGNNFSWDFGQVKEGAVLRHSFIFKNESKNILNIKEVNTSCGCMVSKVEKKRLSPGESSIIKVSFNTKGYAGQTQQYVYVHTDSLDNPVVRFIIKASVVK